MAPWDFTYQSSATVPAGTLDESQLLHDIQSVPPSLQALKTDFEGAGCWTSDRCRFGFDADAP